MKLLALEKIVHQEKGSCPSQENHFVISKATIFFLFKSVICDFMVQGFSSIYDFAWVVQEKKRVSLLFMGSYI